MNIEFDTEILVAFDFDGTFTKNDILFSKPIINKKAVRYFHRINKLNIKTILFTCRHDESLKEALQLLNKYNINFDYINDDNHKRNSGRKINADVYIDDKANDGKIRWHKIYKRIKKLSLNNKGE